MPPHSLQRTHIVITAKMKAWIQRSGDIAVQIGKCEKPLPRAHGGMQGGLGEMSGVLLIPCWHKL